MEKGFTINKQNETIIQRYVNQSARRKNENDPYIELACLLSRKDWTPEVQEELQPFTLNHDLLSQEDYTSLLTEKQEVVAACLNASFQYSLSSSKLHMEVFGLLLQQYAPSEIASMGIGSGGFLPFISNCKVKVYPSSKTSWALAHIVQAAYSGSELDIQRDSFPQSKSEYITFIPDNLDRQNNASVLQKCVENLDDNGTLVAIAPLSFASDSYFKDFRSKITNRESQYSITIVQLPLLKPTSFRQLVAVIINNDHNGNLSFFDASNCANPTEVLNLLNTTDKKTSWHGTIDQVDSDNHLIPSRFLFRNYEVEVKDGEEVVSLGDLIETVHLERLIINDKSSKSLIESLPGVISREALSDNYLNANLNLDNLRSFDEARNIFLTKEDCFLLHFSKEKTLIAKIPASSDKPMAIGTIFRSPHPFKIKNNDRITEEFLLRSLTGEVVAQQMNLLAGDPLMNCTFPDLARIKIAVPSKSKQVALCLEDSRKGISEADRKLIENEENFHRDVHMKKHAIGQIIFQMNALSYGLKSAVNLSKENGGMLNVNEVKGKLSFCERLNQLDDYLQQVSKLIDNFTFDDNSLFDSVEPINIPDYLQDYVEHNKNPDFTIELNTQTLSEVNTVRFNRSALDTIIKNIVSNAWKHGFKNSNDDNRILISADFNGSYISVSIANNGAKMNPQIIGEIFNYGATSDRNVDGHAGIGCYQAKVLMEKDNKGSIELTLDNDSEFPVCFILKFYDVIIPDNRDNDDIDS